MEDFEKQENLGDTEPEAPVEETVHSDTERNTNAPTGWTYSTNTNQYVSWDGGSDPNTASWTPGKSETATGDSAPRKEYGTQYGYYNNAGQTPNYYSNNGANPYGRNSGYQWDYSRYENAEMSQPAKKKSGKGFKVFLGIVAAVLGCCVLALATVGIYSLVSGKGFPGGKIEAPSDSYNEPSENTVETPPIFLEGKPEENDDPLSTDGKMSGTAIYKKVSPSIVGVVQYQYAQSFEPTGEGSGIIISTDGYILTNAHVIKNADTVKVVLYNEEEYEAEIIGSDEQTDIAVLKIDAKNLAFAELGDSDEVEVGEPVYVLGNPGGLILQSSFTDGIISGLNRVVSTEDSNYSMTVIQTNAAINPGNSGGALINAYGQVIGITSSKLVSEKYEGIGFAIPTRTAKPIIEDLIMQGYVSGRAILGITGRTVDSVMARYYKVPEGVQIASFTEGGSFTGTTAAVGDIITALNDEEITCMEDVFSFLTEHSPGDEVKVTLFRYSATRNNDQTFEVTIHLVENKG